MSPNFEPFEDMNPELGYSIDPTPLRYSFNPVTQQLEPMNNQVKSENPNTKPQDDVGVMRYTPPTHKERALEYQCLLAGENEEVQAWEGIAHKRLGQIIDLTKQLGQLIDDKDEAMKTVAEFYSHLGISGYDRPIPVSEGIVGLVQAIFEYGCSNQRELNLIHGYLGRFADKDNWAGNTFVGELDISPAMTVRELMAHLYTLSASFPQADQFIGKGLAVNTTPKA